ncbi:hypothetical protein HPB47_026666 [Ixodes persulcatus]|uniref:Uncharacterized protein n=1 Tax=Ixodes persulcatus TaxID=34615 RepID=A0AC60PZQ1_IXOPE|nr:hypothetical protein HPB47_026666 [Ixodes persulcatus]
MDSTETSSWLPGMLALQELRNWRPTAKGGTPVTNEEMVVAQGRYQRSVTAACLGSCALGTTLGYASSALPSISKEPWYSVHASRWFLDGPLLVAALGALASGFLVSQLGNRRTLLVSAVGFAGGALIVNLSTNMYTLFLGRAVGGFYLGVTYNCATIYVAEIAPADKRTCLAGFVELTEEEKLNSDVLVKRFEDDCLPKVQSARADLQLKVRTCNFGGPTDSMLRDRLVYGTSNKKPQERLLRETIPNLRQGHGFL